MNLQDVLSEPLAFYTVATAILLVAVSALLAIIRLPGVWVPIRTWLVMLPIILGALWIGTWAWTILVALVSVLAFKEFAKVTGLYRERAFVLVVYAAIIAENVSAFLGAYDLFMATPTWAILALTLVPIARNRTEGMLQDLALSAVGVIFFGYFLAHLSYLARSDPTYGLVLYVVLGTQLNDALGFLYGKTLGRHRWTPISPNKTLEGSILAAVTTLILAFGQWQIAMPWVPAWGVAAAGLIVGIGGQIGDLTMANVKRNVGVKDFGSILPGHGGITDRVNSLMITAPAFAHFMGYLFGGFPLPPGTT
jgi:phosphatidate cytidylyltransferase